MNRREWLREHWHHDDAAQRELLWRGIGWGLVFGGLLLAVARWAVAAVMG